jgi:hypothetical protein
MDALLWNCCPHLCIECRWRMEMTRLLGRVVPIAIFWICLATTTIAQSEGAVKGLAGDWVYRLGPNALFALHLEPDPTRGNEARGYLLHPEHFNLNFINGTKLQFSKITNQSQRDALVSIDWQDGALRRKEVSQKTRRIKLSSLYACRT